MSATIQIRVVGVSLTGSPGKVNLLYDIVSERPEGIVSLTPRVEAAVDLPEADCLELDRVLSTLSQRMMEAAGLQTATATKGAVDSGFPSLPEDPGAPGSIPESQEL
jgi:hypothetical protein